MFDRGRKEPEITGEPGSIEAADGSDQGSPAGTTSSGEPAVIGPSIQVSGEIKGNEDLRIEGHVTGTVELMTSSLTIGKQGRIRADLYAKTIIVDGQIEGDLHASESVAIRSSADVQGNVTAPRVGIEDGAKFRGSLEMDQEAVDRALGKTKQQAPAAVPAAPKPAAKKVAVAVQKAAAT